MIKKSNTISVNLSNSAVIALKAMSYMDGHKKISKGKNISAFISGLILRYAQSNGLKEITEERILRYESVRLQKQRNDMDDRIVLLAKKIKEIKK